MHPQTPANIRPQAPSKNSHSPDLKLRHETIALPPALAERLAVDKRKRPVNGPNLASEKKGAEGA